MQMIIDHLKHLADQCRSTYATTKRAIMTAQHWAVLSGSHALEEAETLTCNLMYGEIYSMEEVDEWALKIFQAHQTQTQKTLTELEALLAMAYLQKARLEQASINDTFSEDALKPLTQHIKNLESCHKMISSSRTSNSYCNIRFALI